jgi:ABC-type uncharacterized transport system substrate-binding protein
MNGRPKPCSTRLAARFLASLALLAILAAAPQPARAHPHAWIDVKVKVLFDDKHRIYGLEETWIFDPLYTAFVLEGNMRGKDKDRKPDQAAIDGVSKENLKNIKDYDYLTVVESNGVKAGYAGTRDLTGSFVKDRLRMSFTLLLDKPLDPAAAPVEYMVFDPTYYIEMLHAEGAGAIELSGAGDDCRYTLTPPNPNPNAVALAASLDRTQSAGNGIGRLFAERVTIRCGTAQ